MIRQDHPHDGQPLLTAGAPLHVARAAMVMVHGRGATAASILDLARTLDAEDFAFLAPQAAGNTWYPFSFLMPLEQNEPYLSSALRRLGEVVEGVVREGVPADRVMLLGFSQGACLSLEFVARNPTRFGGVMGFSGGLIGPEGTPRDYTGSLEGTPVFLGSSDPDPHIPVARVRETERVLVGMGATVTTRIYPGMGHTVSEDELEHARGMMNEVRPSS